jgi:hypothetical protein
MEKSSASTSEKNIISLLVTIVPQHWLKNPAGTKAPTAMLQSKPRRCAGVIIKEPGKLPESGEQCLPPSGNTPVAPLVINLRFSSLRLPSELAR